MKLYNVHESPLKRKTVQTDIRYNNNLHNPVHQGNQDSVWHATIATVTQAPLSFLGAAMG